MNKDQFFVEDDIRSAKTISSDVYHSNEVFQKVIEKIFASSWQLAGDLDIVKIPGQITPVTYLEPIINEPILFSRDHKGDFIHCYSNICTHRGTILIEHPTNDRFLRCRYHGRKFSLDGKFVSMQRGTYVTIWKKDADGTWKWVLDSGNEGLGEK